MHNVGKALEIKKETRNSKDNRQRQRLFHNRKSKVYRWFRIFNFQNR